MEKHCNNYFNPSNHPADPTRNHPPEFLELADRIYEFRTDEANTPSGLVSEKVAGLYSVTWATAANGLPAGWQQVFAGDLSAFKRARFI